MSGVQIREGKVATSCSLWQMIRIFWLCIYPIGFNHVVGNKVRFGDHLIMSSSMLSPFLIKDALRCIVKSNESSERQLSSSKSIAFLTKTPVHISPIKVMIRHFTKGNKLSSKINCTVPTDDYSTSQEGNQGTDDSILVMYIHTACIVIGKQTNHTPDFHLLIQRKLMII